VNPRHAAALALVGWYLLVPPQTRFWWIGRQRYDDAAPLSNWTIERSFVQFALPRTIRASKGIGGINIDRQK